MTVERIRDHLSEALKTLAHLDLEPIGRVSEIMHRTWRARGAVIVIGMGSSASLASHFANELNKTALTSGERRLRTISLTDSGPAITARANESTFEAIFAQQLVNFIRPQDLVIGISCSRESSSVLRAMQLAQAAGARTAALTGGTIGRLNSVVDSCIHVPADDLRQIEELLSVILHCIVEELHMLIVHQAAHRLDDGPTIGKRPAIFLDRDGVISENRADYVKSWDEFVFLPNVLEPLRRISRRHLAIVLITNQSGIGRGYVAKSTVENIHQQMRDIIHAAGGRVDAIYYCPHRPAEDCSCRKPKPGLLNLAAWELNLDLTKSFFIGDAVSDVEAALSVGCSPVYVLSGKGREQLPLFKRKHGGNVPVAGNLCDAVELLPLENSA
ncbi:MAG: HAD-IIIA family hydrolase [Anaerolineales bacterium]